MVSTGRMAAAMGAALLTLGVSAPARADLTATNTMRVEVSPMAGCQVLATSMFFVVSPPYTNTKADSTAKVAVTCTPDTSFTIDIDRGQHSLGINRRMYSAESNSYFGYDLYKDPPRSQVWGTGQLQNVPGNSGASGVVEYTIYGRTEQVSKLKAGDYIDQVTITVNF